MHKGYTFFLTVCNFKKVFLKNIENLGNFLVLLKVYIHKIVFIKKYLFQAYVIHFCKNECHLYYKNGDGSASSSYHNWYES